MCPYAAITCAVSSREDIEELHPVMKGTIRNEEINKKVKDEGELFIKPFNSYRL
jgi:hypothetical protein